MGPPPRNKIMNYFFIGIADNTHQRPPATMTKTLRDNLDDNYTLGSEERGAKQGQLSKSEWKVGPVCAVMLMSLLGFPAVSLNSS